MVRFLGEGEGGVRECGKDLCRRVGSPCICEELACDLLLRKGYVEVDDADDAQATPKFPGLDNADRSRIGYSIATHCSLPHLSSRRD